MPTAAEQLKHIGVLQREVWLFRKGSVKRQQALAEYVYWIHSSHLKYKNMGILECQTSFCVSACLNNAWLKKTVVSAICVSPLIIYSVFSLRMRVRCLPSLRNTFLFSSYSLGIYCNQMWPGVACILLLYICSEHQQCTHSGLHKLLQCDLLHPAHFTEHASQLF